MAGARVPAVFLRARPPFPSSPLGPRPVMGYALRQENGAYWPLFFPLVSFQLSPSAFT
jgi:hypothetical protein